MEFLSFPMSFSKVPISTKKYHFWVRLGRSEQGFHNDFAMLNCTFTLVKASVPLILVSFHDSHLRAL